MKKIIVKDLVRAAGRLRLAALDLLYPRRCPVCHEVIGEPGAAVCPACAARPAYIREPFCERCGGQLLPAAQPAGSAAPAVTADPNGANASPETKTAAPAAQEKRLCRACQGAVSSFARNFALMRYDATGRDSIMHFKYHGRQEYGAFYAREWAARYAQQAAAFGVQAVTGVPVHPARRLERGYDQAEVFGRALARELGLPYAAGLLMRRKRTAPQKELGRWERWMNLQEAFGPGRSDCPYEAVLLVDDIYTTGATLEACSRVLLSMGAARILCGTVCVGAAEEADEETGPADAAGAASGIGASEPAKPAAPFGPGIGKPPGQSSI